MRSAWTRISSLCRSTARSWCSRPASRRTAPSSRATRVIYIDGGAYADASALVTDKVGYRLPGPYRWTALRTRAYAVRTTTVPAGSFRGFGGTQANFASESQIDMIARRIGLDPLQVRLKNMLRPGERYLGRDAAIDSDFAQGLKVAAERIGYGKAARRVGAASASRSASRTAAARRAPRARP